MLVVVWDGFPRGLRPRVVRKCSRGRRVDVLRVVPRPSSPSALQPQAWTVPAWVRIRVWVEEVEIWVTWEGGPPKGGCGGRVKDWGKGGRGKGAEEEEEGEREGEPRQPNEFEPQA